MCDDSFWNLASSETRAKRFVTEMRPGCAHSETSAGKNLHSPQPLISWEWSRDLDTGLSLAEIHWSGNTGQVANLSFQKYIPNWLKPRIQSWIFKDVEIKLRLVHLSFIQIFFYDYPVEYNGYTISIECNNTRWAHYHWGGSRKIKCCLILLWFDKIF